MILGDHTGMSRCLGRFKEALGGKRYGIIGIGDETKHEIDVLLGREKRIARFSGMKSCWPVGRSSRITLLAGITKRNQLKSASRPPARRRYPRHARV